MNAHTWGVKNVNRHYFQKVLDDNKLNGLFTDIKDAIDHFKAVCKPLVDKSRTRARSVKYTVKKKTSLQKLDQKLKENVTDTLNSQKDANEANDNSEEEVLSRASLSSFNDEFQTKENLSLLKDEINPDLRNLIRDDLDIPKEKLNALLKQLSATVKDEPDQLNAIT